MSTLPGTLNVLALSGPGFSDQGDLLQSLRFNQSLRLTNFNVGAGPTQLLIEEMKKAHLVLLRGPWTATPEDMLYSSLVAERLKPSFDILRERADKGDLAHVVGMGRGALIVAQSVLAGIPGSGVLDFDWSSELKDAGPWVPVRIAGVRSEIYGLIQGRSIPKVPAHAQGGLNPWVTMTTGQIVGWKTAPGVYLSFVDLLALADRSQLADYGYVDLTGIATQVEILNLLLSGQAFAE